MGLMPPRGWATAVLALVLLVPAGLAACADETSSAGAATLVIETASGEHAFDVELADTDAKRQRGLMFREELAADTGMLFDFAPPRRVSMWMRNTPLPLDMLFIAADGRIAHIAANTVPYSEAIITSPMPVAAVFEVNAGTAARLGIAVGDVVRHPLFAPDPDAGRQAG